MDSLAFVDVPSDTLRAIAARHGLGVDTFARLPRVGVINAIYALGDGFVLRVPRELPGTIAQTRAEAVAAPAARAAGVRTPRLVAFEKAGDLRPVPYLIYERVLGRTLGLLDWETAAVAAVWRELGRDLALLHTGVPVDGPVACLQEEDTGPDPRALAEQRAAEGWFTALEVRWLVGWLGRLASAATTPVPPRMLHLDVQATNVMVGLDTLDYRALVDPPWRGTGHVLGETTARLAARGLPLLPGRARPLLARPAPMTRAETGSRPRRVDRIAATLAGANRAGATAPETTSSPRRHRRSRRLPR